MNEYDIRFMEMARQVSKKSDDPNKKVGAVIVNLEMGIVSTGFNNIPLGIKDREEILNNKDYKNQCIIHAEKEAIISVSTRAALLGCSIYVYPLPPCAQCASLIIWSGISRVIFPKVDKSSSWHKSVSFGKKLMIGAGLELVEVDSAIEDLRTMHGRLWMPKGLKVLETGK